MAHYQVQVLMKSGYDGVYRKVGTSNNFESIIDALDFIARGVLFDKSNNMTCEYRFREVK